VNFLEKLSLKKINGGASTGAKWLDTSHTGTFDISSPVDGKIIASVQKCDQLTYDAVVDTAQRASIAWRKVPSPVRGDVVRQIGNQLRALKQPLGLISLWRYGPGMPWWRLFAVTLYYGNLPKKPH